MSPESSSATSSIIFSSEHEQVYDKSDEEIFSVDLDLLFDMENSLSCFLNNLSRAVWKSLRWNA